MRGTIQKIRKKTVRPKAAIKQMGKKTVRAVAYQFNRLKYAQYSPPIASEDTAIVMSLRQEGVHVTSLAALAIPETDTLLKAVASVLPLLPEPNAARFSGVRSPSSHCVELSKQQLVAAQPAIFLWGLQPRLLNIVEGYLGVPVAYRCVALRKEVPNQQQVGTRLWHRDGEDYRMVRLIIYLNDVSLAGGPFEYIPRSLSPSYRPFRRIHCQIRDGDMRRVVPQAFWKPCPGSKGTVILGDTANVFHHGRVPTVERVSLIYTYSSRCSRNPYRSASSPLPRRILKAIRQELTPRQIDCLWETHQ
jgi:hypothetical protein